MAAAAITDTLNVPSLTVSGSNNGTVSLTLTQSTGAFTGSFKYPGTGKKTSFGGVIYQKPAPAVGSGVFIGKDQTGSVQITQ